MGVKVILDESFIDFADTGYCETMLTQSMLERYPNLLVIKSLGKSYGAPGLRLGVAASADTALIDQLTEGLSIWNIGSLAEFFLQIFTRHRSDYVKSTRQIATDRASLAAELGTIAGFEVLPSQANYLLCKLTGVHTAEQLSLIHI